MKFAVTITHVPLGAVTTLRIVDSILNLKDLAVAWNQARVSREALSRLSPQQLDDIGLTCNDLI
jgi:uncharacterized protein YjiS (DUF1127 family)